MWHPSRKLTPHLILGLVTTRSDFLSREVMVQRSIESGLTPEEAEQRISSFSPLYSKQLRIFLSWLALCFALALCVLSAFLDLAAISNVNDFMNWFPRSGAILVAVAIWMEYEPTRLNSSPTNIPGYSTTPRYNKFLKFAKTIGVWAAVIGTIFWAYGDLLLVLFS